MQDLTAIASSELVEMLMKDTEYYLDLCKPGGDKAKRQLVETHIEHIMAELKSRDGYKEVLDEDISTKTAE